MDYEKKYKEALEWARKVMQGKIGFVLDEVLEKFPELKESEDEKIRKSLIKGFKRYFSESVFNGILVKDILAWLEKQCEKGINGKNREIPFADKVEPKFRIGDIIKATEDGEVFTIRTITKDKYIYTDDSFDWIKDQDEYELVEQKPAEDIDLPEFESYLCLMFQKFRAKGMCTNGEIIDYVKEHSQKLRDILVKPAWSEEDEKMLNNAISACNHCYFQDTIEWLKSLKERVQPQPKQGWSEEDETKIKSIIALLKSPALCTMDGNKGIIDESIKYLKSLKGRVQPQPQQELSMYDETILKSLIDHFEYKKEFNEAEDYDVVLWLKSLKDRYIWKPSNEQMKALKKAMYDLCGKDEHNVITGLYYELEQLKAL